MPVSRPVSVPLFCLGAMFLCAAPQLFGDVTTWKITNATMSGGATVNGTFQYDFASESLIDYFIAIPADCEPVEPVVDCFGGTNFSPNPPTTSIYDLSQTGFGVSQNNPPFFPAVVFSFASPLDPSRGKIDFTLDYFNPGTLSALNVDFGRGTATPLPEPTSWVAIFLLLLSIFGVRLLVHRPSPNLE